MVLHKHAPEGIKEKELALHKAAGETTVEVNKEVHLHLKKDTAGATGAVVQPCAGAMIVSLKSKPEEIATALLEKAENVP